MEGVELLVMGLDVVDHLWEELVSRLDVALQPEARQLAHRLGLVPTPDVPWSQVFGHEVTLAAPGLFAEAMPTLDAEVVRHAVKAQMLAAIEAFGTDRLCDGQVAETPTLRSVLVFVRFERDAALARVCPGRRDASIDFDAAHAATLAAIATERRIFVEGRAVSFETYESVSLGKQSVGFPPSLALALAAGWGATRMAQMRDALTSIWLGLQMPDDVVDWADDMERGGAWAVSLAMNARGAVASESRDVDLRKAIYASGVLPRILERARWHFARVARIARDLGAERLAAWADEREQHTAKMAAGEAEAGGYNERAFALIAWRREVGA